MYRKWLKDPRFQEHIYNFDIPGKAKRRYSITIPCLQHLYVRSNHWALVYMELALYRYTFYDSILVGLVEDIKVEYNSKLKKLYDNIQSVGKVLGQSTTTTRWIFMWPICSGFYC